MASARNLAVVSNEAFSKGEGLCPMSVRLNARYDPEWVLKSASFLFTLDGYCN